MLTDERFILGSWSAPTSIRGEAEYLDAIYRAGRPLVRQGRAALLAALDDACRRTRRELGRPALRELFRAEFVHRVRDWDALVGRFLRRDPAGSEEAPTAAGLRRWVKGFLAPRGHEAYFVDECAEALAVHADFFRRYGFLYP
jgi:hypothetical protein